MSIIAYECSVAVPWICPFIFILQIVLLFYFLFHFYWENCVKCFDCEKPMFQIAILSFFFLHFFSFLSVHISISILAFCAFLFNVLIHIMCFRFNIYWFNHDFSKTKTNWDANTFCCGEKANKCWAKETIILIEPKCGKYAFI